MSLSPYFYLEKYNRNRNRWERIAPLVWDYNHEKMVPADLFPYNGAHEVFEALSNSSYCEHPVKGVHRWRPSDLSPDVVKEIDEYELDDYWDGVAHKCPVQWLTYADLCIHLLKYPEVNDYDKEAEYEYKQVFMKRNPVFLLKERVDAFLEVAGEDLFIEDDCSLTRIVFWVV